jgi:nucleotide-binding universal stress UspA family protein
MLRSIVVPLDGSPTSEESLPIADQIASATGATVHLVRVMPNSPDAVYPHEGTGLPPTIGSEDPAQARSDLETLREGTLHLSPERVEVRVLQGEVLSALTGYATEVDADLLLMGSKAPGTLGRILLGSVADEVVRSTTVPVLVVQSGRGHPVPTWSEMVVALDGSPAAAAVLPSVSALALAFGARITLLRVLAVQIAGGYLPPSRAEEWEREMHEAERHLDRVRNRLRDQGLRTDSMVLTHPSPAGAICEVALEVGADLVAMGTHGRGTIESAVMGSVAQRVISEGPCPVLVRRAQ